MTALENIGKFRDTIEKFKDNWSSFEIKVLTGLITTQTRLSAIEILDRAKEGYHKIPSKEVTNNILLHCEVKLLPDKCVSLNEKLIISDAKFKAFQLVQPFEQFDSFLTTVSQGNFVISGQKLLMPKGGRSEISFRYSEPLDFLRDNQPAFMLDGWGDTPDKLLTGNYMDLLKTVLLNSKQFTSISDFGGSFFGDNQLLDRQYSCGIRIRAPIDVYITRWSERHPQLQRGPGIKVWAGPLINRSELTLTFAPNEGAPIEKRQTITLLPEEFKQVENGFEWYRDFNIGAGEQPLVMLYYRDYPIYSIDSDKTIKVSLSPVTIASVNEAPSKDKNESVWNEFKISKNQFGARINFVKDRYTRDVIFRDIEHAFGCYKQGFSKPAIILAGGVLEEILRQYIQSSDIKRNSAGKPIKLDGNKKPILNSSYQEITLNEDDFYDCIEICRGNKLLKKSVGSCDSIREFRNFVHIKEEATFQDLISEEKAYSIISDIFTVSTECQNKKGDDLSREKQ